MAREKRSLEDTRIDGEDDNIIQQPDAKRKRVPALASVIVEALKVDCLQKLCTSLEPILRKVVSEELECALAKLGPARLGSRPPPKQIQGPDGRNLQLHFKSKLSLPLFTGAKIEGEHGSAIHIELLDANTGHIVTSGPESCIKADVVVLEGDFNNEDNDEWTEEEFESHIVKEREGKRPLLTGDLQVSFKGGVATLGDLMFTDNSSWIRSRKFRLGLRVALGFCEGVRVREAKTEAFTVKDHRGELYKKHYPPALKDEVWRLEKIGKDGSFHKRLNKCGIFTVEDFLRLVVKDSQRLRNILGSGMSNKMWESLVEHAKTCMLSGKYYVYNSDEMQGVAAVFNNIYEFIGLIGNGQYFSPESLTDGQKVFVDALVKKAYDNWMNVIEYDGKVLLSQKETIKRSASPNRILNMPSHSTANDEQSFQPHSSDAFMDNGDIVPGNYMSNQVIQYPPPSQHIPPETNLEFNSSSFIHENSFIASNQSHQFNLNSNTNFPLPQQIAAVESSSHDLYSFTTNEEIRTKSHEMLIENEDMQDMLCVYNTGASNDMHAVHDVGYGLSTYMPSPCIDFNFGEERSRSSGKAVVGWLKIKAAMRWGIFVRKKAAERRAQLIELCD